MINKFLAEHSFNKDDLYTIPHDDEPGSDIPYGNLNRLSHRSDDDVYYVPNLMCGSDYSGGSVTLANYEYMRDEYSDNDNVRLVYGGYGTYGIAINISADWDEEEAFWLIDLLENLDNYPVIDDDALCEVERRIEDEAWSEIYGRCDFSTELGESTGYEVEGEDNFDGPLFALFLELQEKHNEYWIHEVGATAYADVEKLCSDTSIIFKSENWQKLVETGKAVK